MLTTLIPLALVIAISPLSVIPAVLCCRRRARADQPCLSRRLAAGPGRADRDLRRVLRRTRGAASNHLAWASWLRVVLGLALIAFGIYRWQTRHGHTESPKWIRSFATLTPRRAVLTGLVLVVVRLEVLVMCALGRFGHWRQRARHGSPLDTGRNLRRRSPPPPLAIPVLAYAGAGDRLDDSMARIKDWMEKNNAALLAAILVLIGAMVLYNGAHPLLHHA